MQHYYLREVTGFAANYGCSAYGTGSYNSNACGASTATPSGNGASSGLVNTGIAVSLIVGVACLLLMVAIIVRFWRRQARPAVEPVPIDDDTPADDTPPRN